MDKPKPLILSIPLYPSQNSSNSTSISSNHILIIILPFYGIFSIMFIFLIFIILKKRKNLLKGDNLLNENTPLLKGGDQIQLLDNIQIIEKLGEGIFLKI